MSLAEKFRKLGYFFPTYGVCGGSRLDCAIKREELDPLDQLFFDHDKIKYAQTPEEREVFDQVLVEGIRNLKEEDFKKIPVFQWKWPFFKRRYAKNFAKACEKIFD